MTGWMPARSSAPVSAADAVAVFHPPRAAGRPFGPALPAAFARALVLDGQGRLDVRGRAAFLREPRYPALLEYSHGRTAFCCPTSRAAAVLSCAGSPAAAVGVHRAVADALPKTVRAALDKASLAFRVALAHSVADPVGAATEAFRVVGTETRIVHARGETDGFFVWAFDAGEGRYRVAGFTARPSTLTLLFPYLPSGSAYDATWLDDGLDYYVKDGLEVRPATVSRSTKAVVKTVARGGFLLTLCSRP